jgi:hypothetical protein
MDQRTEDAIRAEGAELYVRAVLMLEHGIPTSAASRNTPGYDLIAHNIDSGKNCFVQVKYRGAINSDGARVKNFGFNYMVYVAGNIGRIGRREVGTETRPREIFILPREVVEAKTSSQGLFVSPTRRGLEEYRDAWYLIKNFLFSK